MNNRKPESEYVYMPSSQAAYCFDYVKTKNDSVGYSEGSDQTGSSLLSHGVRQGFTGYSKFLKI